MISIIVQHKITWDNSYCRPPGWLYSPVRMRNVLRKNLTNFEGCHFAWFFILIWWSFPKIETKNFNLGPCSLKLVKLGKISPAAHFLNCVHIGRSQAIAAIICGLSSAKHFVKLRQVFWKFYITNIGRCYREMPWKEDTEAYLCFYSSFPTLAFCRLEKYTSAE